MKEAKTKVDAHRRSNLEHGSAVKRDVIAWNAAAHEQKVAWAKRAQQLRSEIYGERGTGSAAARTASLASKKARGDAVKQEVVGMTAECERQREMFLQRNKERAEAVKRDTADHVTDEAKKVFFMQVCRSPDYMPLLHAPTTY